MAFIASTALVSAAQALPVSGQISFAGYGAAIGSAGMAAATGIDFVSGADGALDQGVAGGLTSFGGGTGSFAGFACAAVGGTCGSIQDLLTFNSRPISNFVTLNNGATTVSFDVSTLEVSRDSLTNTLTLTGTGSLKETGYQSAAGTFVLTAQGNYVTSFSAQATATDIPEPASLALLGGSLALVSLVRRKKA